MRARLRLLVDHVEEKVPAVRGVSCHWYGQELRGVIFIHHFFADRFFLLAHGKRQMRARMALVGLGGINQAAIDIVVSCRRNLLPARGNVFDLYVLEHQRLVAVIGNHEADGVETVTVIIHFEDRRLLRGITGLGRDRNFFVAMGLMQGIGSGVGCGGRGEVLFAKECGGKQGYTSNDTKGFHTFDYIHPAPRFAQPL